MNIPLKNKLNLLPKRNNSNKLFRNNTNIILEKNKKVNNKENIDNKLDNKLPKNKFRFIFRSERTI